MRPTHALLAAALLAASAACAACTEPLEPTDDDPAGSARVADPTLDPLDEGEAIVVDKLTNEVAIVATMDMQVTECAAPKVLICHIPPGNPGNAHTLCVGQPAVEMHVQQHGDNVGMCHGRVAPPPACLAYGAVCTVDAQCCSSACAFGECIDHI